MPVKRVFSDQEKEYIKEKYLQENSLRTNELLKIVDVLYKDATIYLDRKYERVNDFVNNTAKVGV